MKIIIIFVILLVIASTSLLFFSCEDVDEGEEPDSTEDKLVLIGEGVYGYAIDSAKITDSQFRIFEEYNSDDFDFVIGDSKLNYCGDYNNIGIGGEWRVDVFDYSICRFIIDATSFNPEHLLLFPQVLCWGLLGENVSILGVSECRMLVDLSDVSPPNLITEENWNESEWDANYDLTNNQSFPLILEGANFYQIAIVTKNEGWGTPTAYLLSSFNVFAIRDMEITNFNESGESIEVIQTAPIFNTYSRINTDQIPVCNDIFTFYCYKPETEDPFVFGTAISSIIADVLIVSEFTEVYIDYHSTWPPLPNQFPTIETKTPCINDLLITSFIYKDVHHGCIGYTPDIYEIYEFNVKGNSEFPPEDERDLSVIVDLAGSILTLIPEGSTVAGMLSLFWDTYSAYKELFGCEEFTECPDDEDIWVNTTECNLIEGCYGIIKGSLEARVHTPPDGYDNGVFPLGFLIGENSIRVCREYNNDNDNVLPIVTTAAVTSITQTTAVCGGTVTDSGSAEVNARGVCWSTSPSPNTLDEITTDSSGTGEFTSTLTGLTPSTPYYVRAYATNSEGTAYGNTRTFTTSGGGGCGTCVDIDGNSYATIQIGEQCWMAENLKVTHYRDGTVIPNVTAATEWSNLDDTETGAYCEYDNDPSNVPTYGRLYNWYAIDDARGLAPDGWHVSTDEEWKTLEIYLGMDPDTADIWGYRGTNEGSKLAGIADLWYDGDLEDDPEFGSSGFTALPGGYRSYGGTFLNMSYLAYFWSSSEYSTAYAWNRTLLFSSAVVYRLYYDKHYGFSVRCLRD